MILKITNYCRMGCSHCSEDSDTLGEHMSLEVFHKSLEFIKQMNCRPRVLLISGGEPTDHPDFMYIISKLQSVYFGKIIVTSNGMFIEESPTIKNFLWKLNGVTVQITNDRRFYPRNIEGNDSGNFYFVRHIEHVAPFGRALINKLKTNRYSPFCFNFRNLHKKIKSFSAVIYYMEFKLNKFCSPVISTLGEIKIGEMKLCHSIGTIYDSEETLSQNINSMKCNKCYLYHSLQKEYRELVGE